MLRKLRFSHTLKDMEVHLTPEQEAQLAQIATKSGTDPERLAANVVARYLNEEARFQDDLFFDSLDVAGGIPGRGVVMITQ